MPPASPAPLHPLPTPRQAPILPLGKTAAPAPRTDREGRLLPDRARQDLWVARLRAGEHGALREVVEAFSERITSVVAGMIRDRDAVDDVVQETFVKAFFRIRSFKGDSGLYTWLYRVAINASKDHMKKRGRRPAAALDDVGAGAGASAFPSPETPAVERLEDREMRLVVRRAVQSLPPKFRAVLVLRELEGLRYEEIADVLGISLGTVESRLFRARRRLKERLLRMGAPA